MTMGYFYLLATTNGQGLILSQVSVFLGSFLSIVYSMLINGALWMCAVVWYADFWWS